MADFLILAEAAHAAAEHHELPTALGLTPGGWVAASMLAVFAIMLKVGVPKIVAGMLDKQIAEIKKQLDDAAKLRAEAEALKAEYEKKVRDAARDAEAMKAAADEEAKAIVARAKSDATALIERRGKSAEEKIAAAERNAIAELRAKAADAAAQAARGLIATGHDARADKALVDAGYRRDLRGGGPFPQSIRLVTLNLFQGPWCAKIRPLAFRPPALRHHDATLAFQTPAPGQRQDGS